MRNPTQRACARPRVHHPVVVTDVGALGSTVRADRTGWVVPPKDAEALSTALVEALGDEAGLRAAAEAAAVVAEDRSPEAVGRRLASLYERLTGLGPDERLKAARTTPAARPSAFTS